MMVVLILMDLTLLQENVFYLNVEEHQTSPK